MLLSTVTLKYVSVTCYMTSSSMSFKSDKYRAVVETICYFYVLSWTFMGNVVLKVYGRS